MRFYSTYDTFCGKKIIDFDAQQPLQDLNQYVYRIRLDENEADGRIDKKIERFAQTTAAPQVEELVMGYWSDFTHNSSVVVHKLVELKAIFKNLKRLFLGDIAAEEQEISWIEQSDVSPLWAAFPNLELFKVRGGNYLSFGTMHHARLKTILIETGGLGKNVIHEISNAQLPDLEHLEIWLGSDNYGFDATIEDFATLINGNKFPKLKYLGLKNSIIQDEIAIKIANSPILDQIETLDLSMGLMTDVGAQALLDSPKIKNLKFLNLELNYISRVMVEKMEILDLEIRICSQKTPDEDGGGNEYRYVEVSE